MNTTFSHKFDPTLKKLQIFGQVIGPQVVHENDELDYFPSLNAGSDPKIVEISQLTEDELDTFIGDRGSVNEFLRNIDLTFVKDLDDLIVVRTQIIEHENAALEYFHQLLIDYDVSFSVQPRWLRAAI